MTISRRNLLVGLGSALAAPAIVQIANIMPVRNRLLLPTPYTFSYWSKATKDHDWVRHSRAMNAYPGEHQRIYFPDGEFIWSIQIEWLGKQPELDLEFMTNSGKPLRIG